MKLQVTHLHRPTHFGLFVATGALSLLLPFAAQAANTAASGNWSTLATWGAGPVPGINDAANSYGNHTITIDSAQFANTSDFGRVGNAAQMDITPTGSLTIGGSGLGGFEGNIWMAWTHGTTAADSSIINVDGGSFEAMNVSSGMQRTGDHTEINVFNGGSFLITQGGLNWQNGSGASQTQDLSISGAGSTFTVNNHMQVSGGADLMTLDTGGTLTAGRITYDARDNSVFTVGADSTLNLGSGGIHTFTDGLTIDTGATLGTSVNDVSTATVGDGAAFTLNNGAIIDYSINGNLGGGTGDLFDFSGTSQLILNAAHTYELVVDVVAGDVKQTAGPFEIFSGNWTVTGGSLSPSMFNITTASGTRLSSEGIVELGIDAQTGSIVLSGFEAFSIPEPSTAMLLGMGAVVMLLRRRMRR